LHVEGAGFDNVNVYAALDYWNEGVIDGEDPSAAWPEPVEISDGARVPGIDLVILARYDGRNGGGDADVDADGDADGDADADGDTDGDADADRCGISVSGEYDILVAWAGGAVGTMLREPGAARPFRHVVDWSIPSPVAEGAHGAYELGVCKGDGDLDLVAGWDSNGNSLLDPADMWGSYVREPGVDGNPITVGEESLEGYDLEIPTGDGTDPWDFVPFVRISGVVFMEGGFTGVEETARLYVTALKYRPDADITTDDLLEAYDVDTYAYTDLCPTATTCLDDVAYSLVVPASTIVYVWAYLDDDGDGNLNEHGDIIGSIGADEGRIGTGARDSDGMDVLIRRVEE
jgi:hypothetical protein